MAEPKPLKIINKELCKEENFYIINKNDSTAIQVPKQVVNTLDKINNLPYGHNHVFVDVLATAINKRGLENVSKSIEIWTTNSTFDHHYPQCSANQSFSKLLRTFVMGICPTHFRENEIDQLIYFFAKCPHGFDVSYLIRAHHELNPVIT